LLKRWSEATRWNEPRSWIKPATMTLRFAGESSGCSSSTNMPVLSSKHRR
jgi:hypothetical protein